MEKLPKLKVSGLGWEISREPHNFEEAKLFPFNDDLIVTVADQIVHSYEEIVQLVSREPYRHVECLEVVFLPVIVGG